MPPFPRQRLRPFNHGNRNLHKKISTPSHGSPLFPFSAGAIAASLHLEKWGAHGERWARNHGRQAPGIACNILISIRNFPLHPAVLQNAFFTLFFQKSALFYNAYIPPTQPSGRHRRPSPCAFPPGNVGTFPRHDEWKPNWPPEIRFEGVPFDDKTGDVFLRDPFLASRQPTAALARDNPASQQTAPSVCRISAEAFFLRTRRAWQAEASLKRQFLNGIELFSS